MLEKIKGMNLQLFAEGGEGEGQGGEGSTGEGSGDNNTPKTFTQSEVDKLIQSEADKRVTDALKTKEAKWQEEFKIKLEQERREAERLANLSADEKKQEELKKKNDEISQKETELRKRELKLDTISVLSEKKLPVDFADFLMGNDAETTNENIKKFSESFSKAIENAVNERLKGKSPNKGSSHSAEKKFNELTSQERLELRESDPDLYQKMRSDYLNQ